MLILKPYIPLHSIAKMMLQSADVSHTILHKINYQKHINNMGLSPQLPALLSYCPAHLLSSASVVIPLLQEGISGVAVQAFSKPNPRSHLRKFNTEFLNKYIHISF